MTLLKKFGAAILKGLAIVSGIAPIIATTDSKTGAAIQVVSRDLSQIATIIGEVEAVGQALSLPGAQKLTAAAPQVAQVILQSTLLVGHKIANETLFAQGAQKIADGMADILNSLDQSGVIVESKS